MSHCAVFGCFNCYRRDKGKVKFFRFPSDPAIRAQWIRACRRKDPFNMNTARICSVHFEEDAFEKTLHRELLGYSPKGCRKIKKEAVPRRYLPTSSVETEVSKRRRERFVNRPRRNLVRHLLEDGEVQGSSNSVPAVVSCINIGELCRICVNRSHYYANVFKELSLLGNRLFETLNAICQLNIVEGDDLPEYICMQCRTKVSEIEVFKLNSQKGRRKLLSLKNKELADCSAADMGGATGYSGGEEIEIEEHHQDVKIEQVEEQNEGEFSKEYGDEEDCYQTELGGTPIEATACANMTSEDDVPSNCHGNSEGEYVTDAGLYHQIEGLVKVEPLECAQHIDEDSPYYMNDDQLPNYSESRQALNRNDNVIGEDDDSERIRRILQECEVSILEEINDQPEPSSHDAKEDSDHRSESDHDLEHDSGTEYFLGRDCKTKWYRETPAKDKSPVRPNVTFVSGPKGRAREARTPIECFELFVNDLIIRRITAYVNKKIMMDRRSAHRETLVKETNEEEIRVVIGLLILAGTTIPSGRSLSELWCSEGMCFEVFSRAMSLERFLSVLSLLRFADPGVEEEVGVDPLSPFREIFELFVQNCEEWYSLGEYTTLDEHLVEFSGKCPFRYATTKFPGKSWIKVYTLTDSRTWYTSKLEIYTGRGSGDLYNHPEEVVKRLAVNLQGTGRSITTDSWFTSVPLARHLLAKKINLVGAVKKDKPEIPPEFLRMSERKIHSSLFGFQGPLSLVSFVPRERKVILILSTLHNDAAIDRLSNEPVMKSFYDLTKGGADVVNRLITKYSTVRSTRRWSLRLFFYLLDIACVNAQVIHCSNNPGCVKKRRMFLEEVGLSLIKPNLKRKADSLVNHNPHGYFSNAGESVFQATTSAVQITPKKCQETVSQLYNEAGFHLMQPAMVVQQPTVPAAGTQSGSKRKNRRCCVCPRIKDVKCRSSCCRCQRPMCQKHLSTICQDCMHSCYV